MRSKRTLKKIEAMCSAGMRRLYVDGEYSFNESPLWSRDGFQRPQLRRQFLVENVSPSGGK
jgi:hypothetical protein